MHMISICLGFALQIHQSVESGTMNDAADVARRYQFMNARIWPTRHTSTSVDDSWNSRDALRMLFFAGNHGAARSAHVRFAVDRRSSATPAFMRSQNSSIDTERMRNKIDEAALNPNAVARSRLVNLVYSKPCTTLGQRGSHSRNIQRRICLPGLLQRRKLLRRLLWIPSIFFTLAPKRLLALSGVVATKTPNRLWTIPVVAGLLNWATNKLAVLMMFYPLKFRGYRQIGWQGIVPAKARVMSNKIVDDVVLRLIDLKEIFARLPPEQTAKILEPALRNVTRKVASTYLQRRGVGFRVAEPILSSDLFQKTVSLKVRTLIADFVRDVQADPDAVFDIRSVVVNGLSSDTSVLVDLFEQVGEKDLRFVVNSGLFLGGALGVLQMLLWLIWSPRWSLALTGGLVGYVTDQLALNLIFLPVEPKKVGPLTIQGLFLKRQEEVSEEFCTFLTSNLFSPKQIWEELLSGTRSDRFWRLLASRVDSTLNSEQVLKRVLGEEDTEWLGREIVDQLRVELPAAVPLLYDLTEKELDLKRTMVAKMGLLSSAEFERVLHPVFEEDEWILILIGTALGAMAGGAQASSSI